jgi:hypothetical protein
VAAAAAALVLQRASSDFTGPIWALAMPNLGLVLLLCPVSNCLQRWRAHPYDWLLRGRDRRLIRR